MGIKVVAVLLGASIRPVLSEADVTDVQANGTGDCPARHRLTSEREPRSRRTCSTAAGIADHVWSSWETGELLG